MQAKTLLTVFSLLVASCGIPRPDTDVCIVNAPGKKLTCYNLLKDYGSDGKLKPGVKPHFFPASTVSEINKSTIIPFGGNGQGFANLKAYIQKLQAEYQSKCVIQ